MAVPTTITDLSVTAGSNSPAGADTVTTADGPDEYLRAAYAIVRRLQAQGVAVASAATVNLGAIADGHFVHITGTTTITSFGTVGAGISRIVVFDGALTLTHNATSLILRTGANRTTVAGDVAEFISEGSGNWREVFYHANLNSVYQPLDAQLTDVAGLTPTDNGVIIGNGTNFVVESGATLKTSLGLTIGTDVQAYSATNADTAVESTWTAQQTPKNGTLTDAATIDWDGDSNGQVVGVTLGGNRTLGAPTNINQYAGYVLRVAQDGTGSRTLAWNAAYKFAGGTDPVLSTAASAVDIFSFIGGATNTLECIGQAKAVA